MNIAVRVINKARAVARPYWHGTGGLYCPVCDHAIRNFRPLGRNFTANWDRYRFDLDPKRFETLNLNSYECPLCGASDRDRLYAAYLEATHLPRRGTMIEFAPSGPLTHKLKKLFPEWEIRTADLMMPHVMDRIDICSMPIYKTESVDFLICSHVLEHVEDDLRATRELFRILKPGARAIVMVPIHLDLPVSRAGGQGMGAEQRWRHFGQNDHVRLHAKVDFLRLLASTGFRVQTISGSDLGGRKCGINPDSVLYVPHKCAADKPRRSLT
jgi:SAM-dependent methyltransferase